MCAFSDSYGSNKHREDINLFSVTILCTFSLFLFTLYSHLPIYFLMFQWEPIQRITTELREIANIFTISITLYFDEGQSDKQLICW